MNDNIKLIIFFMIFMILIKSQIIKEKEINIVYFVYVNHDRNWKFIVNAQLNDIIKSNILSTANLYIVVTDEKEIVKKSDFDEIMKDNNYNIEFHKKNYFEYWGLKKLYNLAQKDPQKIYLYLHTKGMVFHNNNAERNNTEKYLTNDLLNNYLKVLNIFNDNNKITKIGTMPSIDGFVWFNFFYVRGTYLIKCKQPIISDNRYYYEIYLQTENLDDKTDDSYSLYSNSIQKYNLDSAINFDTNLNK